MINHHQRKKNTHTEHGPLLTPQAKEGGEEKISEKKKNERDALKLLCVRTMDIGDKDDPALHTLLCIRVLGVFSVVVDAVEVTGTASTVAAKSTLEPSAL